MSTVAIGADRDIEWQQDVDLSAASTLGLQCRAERLARVRSLRGLVRALEAAGQDRVLVLGGGSNLVLPSELAGVVVQWRNARVDWHGAGRERASVYAQAGASWDRLVRACAARNLWGIENLALIPGTVGAAPIQNIGAYGQELADTCEAVCVWDRRRRAYRELNASECGFRYRDSRFRQQPERWVVVGLRLQLWRRATARLDYPGVADELEALGLSGRQPADLVAAITTLRQRKLPDPAREPNAGSFFYNPIVSRARAEALQREFPGLPWHPIEPDQAKLSAAWLIEQSGWRGRFLGPVGMSERHALVMVRHGPAVQADVLALKVQVEQDVQARFGVRLQVEPGIVS